MVSSLYIEVKGEKTLRNDTNVFFDLHFSEGNLHRGSHIGLWVTVPVTYGNPSFIVRKLLITLSKHVNGVGTFLEFLLDCGIHFAVHVLPSLAHVKSCLAEAGLPAKRPRSRHLCNWWPSHFSLRK